MNLGQLRQAFRNVKTPPGVRKAFTTRHRGIPSTKRSARRDAIAVVLGIPVSFLTLWEIVRSASVPDDAEIDVPVSGGGLRIRWRRPSGGRGGFELVSQDFDGPRVEIRAVA